MIRCSRPDRPGWKSAASSTAPTLRGGLLAVAGPEEQRPARGRPDEPEQHPQRRRLAGAVRPEKAGHRAGLQPEGEIVDGEHLPEALGQVVDDDDVVGPGGDGRGRRWNFSRQRFVSAPWSPCPRRTKSRPLHPGRACPIFRGQPGIQSDQAPARRAARLVP